VGIFKISGLWRARIFITALFVIMGLTFYFPISIPLPMSKNSRQYLEFIESIPSGVVVGFMMGETPETRWQLQSSTVLTMVELWERDCKIVFWYDNTGSGPFLLQYVELAKDIIERQIVYGEDYVNLGYVPFGEVGLATFLSDLRARGNHLDDLEAMRDVRDGSDLQFGIVHSACSGSVPRYIRQWQRPYNAKIASINCASDRALLSTYLDTGQLKGMAIGLLGSAEIEFLTGNIGMANRIIVAVSFVGLAFIVYFVIEYAIDRYLRARVNSKVNG
jgi:hypothetical protein